MLVLQCEDDFFKDAAKFTKTFLGLFPTIELLFL